MVEARGFEPLTPCLQSRCSPTELSPQGTRLHFSGSPPLGQTADVVCIIHRAMDTARLVAEYLAECNIRGLAAKTKEQYAWALVRLEKDCPTLPCTDVEVLTIVGDPALKLESRRDLLKSLRVFFRWAHRRHQLPNPCDGLQPLPRQQHLPRVLTEEEVIQLVAAADNARDRVLLLLVLDSGLRLGEVAGLRHADLRGQWLEVSGKVGMRQVPVSPEVMITLKGLGNGDHVWTGLKGPLAFHGVKLAYRRLFDRAGIRGPKKGAHTLRHTFATMWLRYGGGLRQLQTIMGHKHIETTMIYVHLAGHDVLVEHARYSPVRTLGLVD